LELTFTLSDPTVFQVLEDTAPPRLLAALDAADGLYLAFDEAVEVASGFTLDTSIAVLRQGQPVAGRVTRLSPLLFRWQPAQAGQWLAGGQYTLSAVHLQDLSGKAATAPSLSFTHMAASSQVAYLVYQAPSDSQPQPRSSYGLTTLFQGRTWHEELGLYHYRARWYSPELGDFLERDPLGYFDSPNLYQFLNRNPVNFLDPLGEWFIVNLVEKVDKDGKARLLVTSGLYMNDGSLVTKLEHGTAKGQDADSKKYPPAELAKNGTCPPDTTFRPHLELEPHVYRDVCEYRKAESLESVAPTGTAARRALINADTPYGVYLAGWSNPIIQRIERGKRKEDVERYERYGPVKINFDPVALEPGAVKNQRNWIRMHGGRADLVKNGELWPTQGCLRFRDEDLKKFAESLEKVLETEKKRGVILIGDKKFFNDLLAGASILRPALYVSLAKPLPDKDVSLEEVWRTLNITQRTGVTLEVLKAKLSTVVKGGW
jgi:RHS repeat-associated protein